MTRGERRRRTTKKLLERIRFLRAYPGFPASAECGCVVLCRDLRELIGYRDYARLIGRCKSKHPLDCGRARCGLCSPRHRFGREETLQEMKARLTMEEDLKVAMSESAP